MSRDARHGVRLLERDRQVNKQGAIAQFENDDDARAAGYKTKLTEAELKFVAGLSRSGRRKALAKHRCETASPIGDGRAHATSRGRLSVSYARVSAARGDGVESFDLERPG